MKSVLRSAVILTTTAMLASTLPAQALEPTLTAAQTPAAKSTPPKSAEVRVKKTTKLLVTPKAGARISTHEVRVKVKARRGIERAKLNKVRLLPSDFQWQKGPYYTLAASASHGLKHNRNTLTVVARNSKAGLSKQQISFRVTHKKPLTGAGRDSIVATGSQIVLPGTVRVSPDSQKTPSTDLDWKVVRAPGADPALLPLAPANSNAATLTTTSPGTYVVKAVGSAGNLKTEDTVTTTVVDGPSIRFETSTRGPRKLPGILIGDTVYEAYGDLSLAQWQVLLVNREDGSIQADNNFTYGTCPTASNGICRWNSGGMIVQSPRDDLAGLDDKYLVVAVHHSGFGGGMGKAAAYFAAVGAPKNFSPSGQSALMGATSYGPGDAYRAVNSARGLSGSLQWDLHKKYVYVSSDRTTFDTRAGGECDTSYCTVTMEVNGDSRTYSVDHLGAGFAIQAVDRTSLQVLAGKAWDLSGTPPEVTAQVQDMLSFLDGQPDSAMIMIASLGSPDHSRMNLAGMKTKYNENCWLSVFCDPYLDYLGSPVVGTLAQTIANLGGTRHAFLQSTRKAGDNYSMVGWRGLGETGGAEVHSEEGRLSGAVVRGRDNRFETANVTEDGEAQELLTSLVARPPNPAAWPGAGDPVYQKALDDIGKRTRIGADPRGAFWNRDEALEEAYGPGVWTDASEKAEGLSAPSGWSAEDLTTWGKARDELVKELVWVGTVRTYFRWMKHPYAPNNQMSAWLNSNNVASTLKSGSDWANSQKVTIDWAEVFAILIEAIAPFAPFAGKAAEKILHIIAGLTAASLEYTAMGLTNKENGARVTEEDEQAVEALDVETKVVTQMQDAADSLDRMADVIVSDHYHLSTLGEKTSCNYLQTECEPGFATMTNTDFDRMSVNAKRTAERTVFTELLPVAWDVTRVPRSGYYSGAGYPEGNWDAKRYQCNVGTLFGDLPDRANIFTMRDVKYQFSETRGLPAFRTPQFQVYVIAQINSRYSVIAPDDATVLGRMFKPMSSSFDPKDGGLGVEPADFMAEVERSGRMKDYGVGCGGWVYSDNNTPAPVD